VVRRIITDWPFGKLPSVPPYDIAGASVVVDSSQHARSEGVHPRAQGLDVDGGAEGAVPMCPDVGDL
jgi:hypothetical protein